MFDWSNWILITFSGQRTNTTTSTTAGGTLSPIQSMFALPMGHDPKSTFAIICVDKMCVKSYFIAPNSFRVTACTSETKTSPADSVSSSVWTKSYFRLHPCMTLNHSTSASALILLRSVSAGWGVGSCSSICSTTSRPYCRQYCS